MSDCRCNQRGNLLYYKVYSTVFHKDCEEIMFSRNAYSPLFYKQVFIGFTFTISLGLTSAFLPILALQLDPSEILVGVVVSSWFFSRIFIEIPSGILSDRIGRRKPLIYGLLISAIGSLICASSTSIYQLIIGITLWGFGAAFFFLNNVALILDQVNPKIRGKAVAVFHGMQFMGSIVGAPLGAFLSIYIGYQNVFYLAFTLIALSFIAAFTSTDIKNVGGNPVSLDTQNIMKSLKSLWNWNFIAICFVSLLRLSVAVGITSTVLQLYLNQQLNFDIGIIGIIVSSRGFGFITGTFLSGNIIERIRHKKIVMLGLSVDGLCIYLLTTIASFELVTGLIFFAGVGSGLVYSTLTVWLNKIVKPEHRGISIGLNRTFMDVGGLLGPIFFVFIHNTFNVYTAFLVAGLTLFSAIFLTITVKQNRIQQEI